MSLITLARMLSVAQKNHFGGNGGRLRRRGRDRGVRGQRQRCGQRYGAQQGDQGVLELCGHSGIRVANVTIIRR